MVRARTETIELLVTKLNPDPKMKDVLVNAPLRVQKDDIVASFVHMPNYITYDMPNELARHLIERSTKKLAHDKIAEQIERDV